MMKAITGQIIKTEFGEMLIYNEQNEFLSVGDLIIVNGIVRKVLSIQPPSKPDAKWAISIE